MQHFYEGFTKIKTQTQFELKKREKPTLPKLVRHIKMGKTNIIIYGYLNEHWKKHIDCERVKVTVIFNEVTCHILLVSTNVILQKILVSIYIVQFKIFKVCTLYIKLYYMQEEFVKLLTLYILSSHLFIL